MDKIEIQEAILVLFNGEEKINSSESGIKNQSKRLSFTNVKSINCVVDEKRGNAVDLETGHIYHIIQRDDWGILSKEEVDFINNSANDDLFVYSYYKKDMKDISLLYQMYLNSRAQKKYQEYLDEIKKEEITKVKKIVQNKPDFKIGK